MKDGFSKHEEFDLAVFIFTCLEISASWNSGFYDYCKMIQTSMAYFHYIIYSLLNNYNLQIFNTELLKRLNNKKVITSIVYKYYGAWRFFLQITISIFVLHKFSRCTVNKVGYSVLQDFKKILK